MNTILKLTSAPALALLLISSVPSAAQSACLSSGEIRQAVAEGRILPLEQILPRGGVAPDSKVLQPVEVCDRGGQLYYQLSVLDRDGNARKVVLHALTGGS